MLCTCVNDFNLPAHLVSDPDMCQAPHESQVSLKASRLKFMLSSYIYIHISNPVQNQLYQPQSLIL